MTVPSSLRRARVAVTFFSVVLWACSGSDPAPSTDDGSKSPVAGSKAGSSSVGDGDSGGAGSSDGPTTGTGNTGSVGEEDPDDEPAKGGKASQQPEKPEPEQGDGGSESEGPKGPTEGFLRGQAFVAQNECAMCHTEDFSGFTVFPNITPDAATGIGKWTDAQIVAAIRDGVEPDGSMLCDTMARYPLNDAQAADVVEFLRGIPGVSNRITSDCP